MNWLGKIVQDNVRPSDTVISIGCGVMQDIDGLQCKHFSGIDIYEPYLNMLKSKGYDVRHGDIVTMTADDIGKHDIILLLDILEHIEKIHFDSIIEKCKQACRRAIFAYTPSQFYNNVQQNWKGEDQDVNAWLDSAPQSPYKGLGVNTAQAHVSLITMDDLSRHGFQCWQTGPDNNIFAAWTLENVTASV